MAHVQYQKLCELVRKRTSAAGAIVIVLRGKHGSGYAVETSGPMSPTLLPVLPSILRDLATQLDKEQGIQPKERRHARG